MAICRSSSGSTDQRRAWCRLADVRDQDEELIREFLGLLQGSHADYTIVWRELGGFLSGRGMVNDRLREHFLNRERFDAWAVQYAERLRAERSRDDEATSHEPCESEIWPPQLPGPSSH